MTLQQVLMDLRVANDVFCVWRCEYTTVHVFFDDKSIGTAQPSWPCCMQASV